MPPVGHLIYFLLFIASVALAQQPVPTNAQSDDLSGEVKSVSTSSAYSGIPWVQPAGPTLVTPIWCRDCEYDYDGTKTKSGQAVDGVFHGETIRLGRGADGRVTDRIATDVASGQLERHDVMGAFGKTAQTFYAGGKLSSWQTVLYDQHGNFSDLLSFDAEGNQQSHLLISTDKHREITERSAWGKNGQLDWQQTFDPGTQVERLTTFDEFGKVKLTWMVSRGDLIMFWEPSDSPSRQAWDNFNERVSDDDVDNYACQNTKCEVCRIHYEYLDAEKHNAKSAEWHDSSGELRFGAYYKYEIDPVGNWTYREVWVWNAELGERALYETDFRQLTYWQK